MPRVWFIRHGQSEANAGGRSADAVHIPLTALGHRQAGAVSRHFARAPGRIVYSPFTRAVETARPTRERFPEAPSASWPVQEFSYLSPARCRNTTSAERLPWVEAYWARADPDALDGPGVESFRAFLARVQDALSRLRARHEAELAVFTHGQFMQAVMWLLGQGPQPATPERMGAFRPFMAQTPVPNAAILPVELGPDGARVGALSTAHLDGVPISY